MGTDNARAGEKLLGIPSLVSFFFLEARFHFL
jgi:hypothetical protein